MKDDLHLHVVMEVEQEHKGAIQSFFLAMIPKEAKPH